MKDDCLFCKLANGVFPTNSIYEDDDFNVILNIAPATKGHALILPKKHYKDVFEIEEELLGKAIKLGKEIMTKEKEILGCQGYNVLQNNGEVAGQTIFHFHFHLIPRYDEPGNDEIINWEDKTCEDEVLKALCQTMKLK